MTDNTKMREAFEKWLNQGNHCGCNENMWKAWQAAQAEQSVAVVGEPVAWMHEDEYKEGVVTHRVKKVLLCAYTKRRDVHTTPLYLAPTHSIPATEIDALRERLAQAERELERLRKDAEKRDEREDRQWRAGFMAGWNAGVIGDEAALKKAGERLDAAIAQGKGE